tara:strand:- start:9396 stop:10274 length:879 start_codon:yes stop_codon:yes gene_type:complete
MKNLRSQLVFTKSQQRGIFLLVILIILFQCIYFFINFSTKEEISEDEDGVTAYFQKQIDSLKIVKAEETKGKIYPFNPNYITDFKGYSLGMSLEEIDRLLEFRRSNKWVNSAQDFQAVTLISDSLLANISPYFKFPEWVENRNSNKFNNTISSTKALNTIKQDLNLATEADLIKVKGVGEVLSARIIKYRTKLGGFVSEIQLKDIYGLNYEAKQEILQNFKVISKPEINRLDINKATVLELASVPYIDYELAREIVNYKLLHEEIVTFEELAKIKSFPSEKIDRIALYLTLE